MISSKAVGQPKCCDKEGKPDKSCPPTQKENERFRKHQEQRNKRRKKHGKKTYGIRDMTWKDKHCKNLLFNLNADPEKITEDLKKVEEEFKELKDDLYRQAQDIATGAVKERLEKAAGIQLCAGIGAAIGGAFGFFFGAGAGAVPAAAAGAAAGEAVCGAAAVVDTAVSIPKLWSDAAWVKEQIVQTKQALQNLNGYQKTIRKIADIKNDPSLSEKERSEAIDKIKEPILKAQEEAVDKNPCLKSKRCELAPYKKSVASVYPRGAGRSPTDSMLRLDRPDGCCPGQQAHHVIPAAKVRGCPGYDHDKAPTVCVEGGNNNGTHGKLHMATDANTQRMVDGEYKHNPAACKDPASMEATIEASAQAMKDKFGCDKECVAKELKKFYAKLCPNGVALKDRNGKVIEASKESQEGKDGL